MRTSSQSVVSYWRKGDSTQNFGDYISEYLSSHLFYGYRTGVSGVHLIGSVVDDMFVPPDTPRDCPVVFWGCGVREPDGLSRDRWDSARIATVRGPLSASELELGALTPQGDPAFLLPALYTPRKLEWLAGKSICVPHFDDARDDRTILASSGCDFVVRPNIENHQKALTDVIDAIFSADFVLAGAMHACIVAAAYRTPFSFWSAEAIDLPFKWRDLAMSLDIPCEFSKHIDDARPHYENAIAPSIKLPDLVPSLLRAPLLIRPSGLIDVLRWSRDAGCDALAGSLGDNAAVAFFAYEQQRIHDGIVTELLAARQRTEELERAVRQTEFQLTELEADEAARRAATERVLSAALTECQDRNAEMKQEHSAALAEALDHNAHLTRELTVALQRLEAAESELARLNKAVGDMETRHAGEAAYRQRTCIGKMLFRRDGRPVRGLRRILFHNSGKPRGALRTLVISKRGVPRKPFRQWMTGEKYQSLPRAYRSPVDVAAPPVALPVDSAVAWLLAGLPAPVGSSVLIIDSVYPTPDRDSGSVDAVNFVKVFLELGYQVYFVSTVNFISENLTPIEEGAKSDLSELGAVVVDDNHFRSIYDLIGSIGSSFELIFMSRVHAAGIFVEAIREHCQDSKIIFNTVDLHFIRELREGYLEENRTKINAAYRTREREIYVARMADATIVVSAEEESLLKTMLGTPVYEVPLIREIPGRQAPLATRKDIGFIGGYRHEPNVDAAKYFLDFIWPLIRRELPGVQFYLMGADMPDELRQRTDPGLVVLGHVPDLTEIFEGLRLTVAPLRYGAGQKGKVVSSLSHGVPCVCSSIAAEGMNLPDGSILVADDPREFTSLVVEAYRDDALWERLSDAGLDLVRKRHGFPAGVERMKAIVQRLGLDDTTAPIGGHNANLGFMHQTLQSGER